MNTCTQLPPPPSGEAGPRLPGAWCPPEGGTPHSLCELGHVAPLIWLGGSRVNKTFASAGAGSLSADKGCLALRVMGSVLGGGRPGTSNLREMEGGRGDSLQPETESWHNTAWEEGAGR